jgi:hypothetical protein
MNGHAKRKPMTNYPILFNQSPEQLRRIGARGGRAYGRNQRARRAGTATPPETVELRVAPLSWKPGARKNGKQARASAV